MTNPLVDAWLFGLAHDAAVCLGHQRPLSRTNEAVAAEIIRRRARDALLLAVKDAAASVFDGSRMMPQAALRALGEALDDFEEWEKANG